MYLASFLTFVQGANCCCQSGVRTSSFACPTSVLCQVSSGSQFLLQHAATKAHLYSIALAAVFLPFLPAGFLPFFVEGAGTLSKSRMLSWHMTTSQMAAATSSPQTADKRKNTTNNIPNIIENHSLVTSRTIWTWCTKTIQNNFRFGPASGREFLLLASLQLRIYNLAPTASRKNCPQFGSKGRPRV